VRVLALDFDGVISDSAPECFVVALRAYLEVCRDARWGVEEVAISQTLAEASTALGPTPDSVRSLPRYRRFLELMPLGNRAEDFAVALSAIDADADLVDQSAYDLFKARLSSDFLATFHARFYALRTAWCELDPDSWNSMTRAYPEFLALLRRRAGDSVFALATAKDRRSVEILLRHYGAADLFAKELVLDKEAGMSKRAHLQELRVRADCQFEDIIFVDDKVNHLDDVASLGVRCALAAWGYNAQREQRQAQSRGHWVCTLENAESLLFPDS
jgi:phosphoglycolate phosphatase-like HAD superfamily hydrolase